MQKGEVKDFNFEKLLDKRCWLGESKPHPFAKKPYERAFCAGIYDAMAFRVHVRQRAIADKRDLFDTWCLRKIQTLLGHLKQVTESNLVVPSASVAERDAKGVPLRGESKGYLWKLPRGVDPWSTRSWIKPQRWEERWFELDVVTNEEQGRLRFYKTGDRQWEKCLEENEVMELSKGGQCRFNWTFYGRHHLPVRRSN